MKLLHLKRLFNVPQMDIALKPTEYIPLYFTCKSFLLHKPRTNKHPIEKPHQNLQFYMKTRKNPASRTETIKTKDTVQMMRYEENRLQPFIHLNDYHYNYYNCSYELWNFHHSKPTTKTPTHTHTMNNIYMLHSIPIDPKNYNIRGNVRSPIVGPTKTREPINGR